MWFVCIPESGRITSDLSVKLQMTAGCMHLIRQNILIINLGKRERILCVYVWSRCHPLKKQERNNLNLRNLYPDKFRWTWNDCTKESFVKWRVSFFNEAAHSNKMNLKRVIFTNYLRDTVLDKLFQKIIYSRLILKWGVILLMYFFLKF